MPAYISHAIFGHSLYQTGDHDEKIFKVKINPESLKTYSLGIDLATLCIDVHSVKTQAFLLNLIKTIKDYHLEENEEVLAFLYGHISHFFMDTNIHPLIFYIEKGCKKTNIFDPHTLIEGYISEYLAYQILNCDVMTVKSNFFNQADLNNPDVARLINSEYKRIYNQPNILSCYKRTIRLLTVLESFIKNFTSKDMLLWIASFQNFLDKNKLTREEIHNSANASWKNPVTGEVHYKSLIDLYYRSLEMTLYAILKVNAYLYDNAPLSTLEGIFPNISYDTGVDISKGFDMAYTRKRR